MRLEYVQCDNCKVVASISPEEAMASHGWGVNDYDCHYCGHCMDTAEDLEKEAPTDEEIARLTSGIDSALNPE
jgi:MinD superfamily P-loop ATPase